MSEKGAFKLGVAAILVVVVFSSHLLWHGGIPGNPGRGLNKTLGGHQNTLPHYISRKALQEEKRECAEIHDTPLEEKCDFVRNTPSCAHGLSLLPYYEFIYCVTGNAVWGGMIVLVFWWLFLFVGLAVTADGYFCPALVVISKTLQLSPNVAGATFLAFGNGAPDFFASLTALTAEDADTQLVVGGLFGGGMFVTTTVVGAICLIKPFRAASRPFLRDAIFYLGAVYWLFFMLWKETVYLGEAIGFMALYFVYVIVVVISGSVYGKRQPKDSDNVKAKSISMKKTGELNPAFSNSSEHLPRLTSVNTSVSLVSTLSIVGLLDKSDNYASGDNLSTLNDELNTSFKILPESHTLPDRLSDMANCNETYEDINPSEHKRSKSVSFGLKSSSSDSGLSDSDNNSATFKNKSDRKLNKTVSFMSESSSVDDEDSDITSNKVTFEDIFDTSLATINTLVSHISESSISGSESADHKSRERLNTSVSYLSESSGVDGLSYISDITAACDDDDEQDTSNAPAGQDIMVGATVVQSNNVSTTEEKDPEESMEEEEEEEELFPTWKIFLQGINPINTAEWPEMRFYLKFYEIFKSPIIFVITLTCPVVLYGEGEMSNWNRPLNILHCLIGLPMAWIMVGQVHVKAGPLPVWVILLIIGAILATAVFFTSENGKKPKYHNVFGYVAFLLALVWIYVIAGEIVQLLQAFGVVLNISNALLGLTLLAWGNCIGDVISDTVMARQGFARMGFAACFAGPLFTLTLGFGLSITIKIINEGGGQTPLLFSPVQMILGFFLMGSVMSSLIAIPLMMFKIRRAYGIYLLIFYAIFLVTAILTETGIILNGFTHHIFSN